MKIIGQNYNPSVFIYLLLCVASVTLSAQFSPWLTLIVAAVLLIAGKQNSRHLAP